MINILRFVLLAFHVGVGLATLSAIVAVAGWFMTGKEQEYLAYLLIALYAVWIVMNLTSFGDRFQDLTLNTRQPSPRELKKLNTFVSELETRSIVCGVGPLPSLRLRMISDEAPNAMAFGSMSVALTTGMLKVDKNQARAALAHELGHLVNKDTLYGSVKMAALHPLILIWYFILRPVSKIGGWICFVLLFLILPIFLIGLLAWLVLNVTDFVERLLLQPAEYRADAYAVCLTRDTGLSDFLDHNAPLDARPANTFMASYLMNHPPTELRHARAEAILAELGKTHNQALTPK